MASFMLILGIAAVSMFFITRPLFATNHALPEGLKVSDTIQQRSEVMMALNELEYDYRMNKLSKEDYEAMVLPLQKLAMSWMEGEKQASEQQRKDAEDLRKQLEDEIEQALQKKGKGTNHV